MTTSTHLHEKKKTNVTLFIGSASITILFIIQFPELLQLRKQAGSQEDVYVAINVWRRWWCVRARTYHL